MTERASTGAGQDRRAFTPTLKGDGPHPAGFCARPEERLARRSDTTARGGPFDTGTIETVWLKAGADPAYVNFRKDACGATILRNDYGKTTDYGWEIDHIKPVTSGGTDSVDNLQPLHWENNRCKADRWPHWTCKRTS